MFKKYIENKQKTVIFVSEDQKTFVERKLLEEIPAYFHITVTTIERYVLDVLKKNHLFKYELLSKKTSLLAVKKSIEIDDLVYFKDIQLSEGIINALLEAYQIIADLPFEEIPNEGKWLDLKRMYQTFCEYKQSECFIEELLYKAIPYIPKDVCFVNVSYNRYSRALDLFFKQCCVEEIDLVNKCTPKDFYKVQFMHQELDLTIQKISEGLKQGNRFNDYIIYVPNNEWIKDFISRCPYPTNYQLSMVNNRDDALIDAFCNKDFEKMKQLAYIDNEWFEEIKKADNHHKKELLEEIVSYSFEELPNDLDFDTYCLFTKLLYSKDVLVKDDTLDSIIITTYKTPIVFKTFKHVFCLGLNEDEYPSKITESALILNSELIPFYKEGTPIIRNSNLEWKIMEDILKTSNQYTLTCHFGSLAGEELLPSLLYLQIKGSNKEKVYKEVITIGEDIMEGDVEPLNNPKAFYNKEGISPSEVETFNACPYKHFLSYGLKIRPVRRKLETKAKFGTLMHDLLDLCAPLFKDNFIEQLETMEKKYSLDSKEGLDNRLVNLTNALIKSYNIDLIDGEEQYLYRYFPTQFLNTLKILLYHVASGEFRLAYHEEKFDYIHNNVHFLGRIDRADVYKDYIKIMDYKSSNKTLDLAMALEGFNVQMAMYLEMISKHKNLKKGALLYFNTRTRKLDADGKMNIDGTSSEDFEAAYQMEGWLLEDDKHEVMYGVDHNFPESKIAHMRYVKSKDAYSGKLLTEDKLNRLIKGIFKHLHQLVDRCFDKGDISIAPAGSDKLNVQMKVSPCQYCDYQDVCMRDPFYHEHREIVLLEKDELEEFLGGGKQDGESNINE